MAWTRDPSPAGGEANTGLAQPRSVEEYYAPPTPGRKGSARRVRRVRLIISALIVAAVVTAGTIIVLALFVPMNYPEHVIISLNAQNQWNESVCIPTESVSNGPQSVKVSFAWTSSDSTPVQLVIYPAWPFSESVPYNVTATSGSGSYLDPGSSYYDNVWLDFVAYGAPTLPTFVNISMSYDVPGHVLGGHAVPAGCI